MRRRTALLVVVLAASAAAGVWRLAPAATPPLYDGVCLADPYHFVGQTPAPSSASKQYPASSDFLTSELVTGESPPQAQVLLTDGTFISPAAPFTLSITPVSPPAAPPSGWSLDGNVYRIEAVTSAGSQLQPQPNHPATILLRATSSNPPKTMYRWTQAGWTQLKTFSAGCGDTFEAVSPTMGDFALLTAQSGGGSNPAPGGGAPVLPIVVALLVVVAATVGGLLYLNRGPAR